MAMTERYSAAATSPAERHVTQRSLHQLALTLSINGSRREIVAPACATLLEVLRDRISLQGTKKGCDLGACGACTVLIDGRRIYACLALAAMQEGKEITTIEGLAEAGELHRLQRAFIERDALQCGYCTPGQLLSAAGLLAEGGATDERSIREQMSGNLCRCGAYPNIVAAIAEAARP